jgi:hypothetical protein
MALVDVPEEQDSQRRKGEEDDVLDFHWTPPFRRPSGPVMCSAANSQDKRAMSPTTPSVTENRKMIG